jgi:hypothetical protein
VRVFVNGAPVDLLPGMKVRHALIQLGFLTQGKILPLRVQDEYGNLLGLDGAVHEGMRIVVTQSETPNSS